MYQSAGVGQSKTCPDYLPSTQPVSGIS